MAFREAWFRNAALLLTGLTALSTAESNLLAQELASSRVPVLLAGEHPWRPEPPAGGVAMVPFPSPDAAARRAVWQRELAGAGLSVAEPVISRLAGQYRLGPARIAEAVTEVALVVPDSVPDALAVRGPAAVRARSGAAHAPGGPHLRLGRSGAAGRDPAAAARTDRPGAAPAASTRRVAVRAGPRPGARHVRAVRGTVRHRQDHGRGGDGGRTRARPVRDRPGHGGEQVHRRDREEPGADLHRGRAQPTPSCSSTRPTRCSASAPR